MMQDKCGGSGSSHMKVAAHFQVLEKMNVPSAVRTLSSDDLQQVRHAANRILTYIMSQGETRVTNGGCHVTR